MKSILFFAYCLISVFPAHCQSGNSHSPSFAAVVVANMNASSSWYQSVFGLTVKSETHDTSQGHRLTLLTSGVFEIELLELSGSLKRSSVLAGQPSGTQIQGLFKVGFKLSNMDSFLSHLANVKVTVPRVWTDQSTGKRNFLITDPDGNYIQFFE